MSTHTFTRTWIYRFVAAVLVVAFCVSSLPFQGAAQAAAAPAAVKPADLAGSNPLGEMLGNTPLADTLAKALPGMPGLGPDGQPVGMLMDAGAMQAQPPHEPDALTNPISVSRVQSAYRAAGTISGTLVVTFTVTNNRPPVVAPTLPVSPTENITATMDAIAQIDLSKDPNVIRNVLLADTLLASATFVDSTPLPDHKDAQYAWNLGDIPPLGSITATLTLRVPANVADFTDLDTGASAWGTLQGRMVSTQAHPANLAPDTITGGPIGDWLKWTVDADTHDEYMLEKAAELGQDPMRMFAYVRSLGYESYKGSLRGTRGTLWSEAGNALDQASLLIAMLRASGIPARYRHGTLDKPLTQALILSMFPTPTQIIGHIPPGTEVSDPANDPQLLEETQDHWWVEAYLPGQGWKDLDPTFSNAAVGQAFAASVASDGTDRVAEVPDGQRHKVTMKVKVEQLDKTFPTGADPFKITYPLSVTFNSVELVGEPVTLGHLVNSFDSSKDNGFCNCGVFRVIEHSYTPYFQVGDRVIQGKLFQEMISNFPFGTMYVTGEWLEYEVQDAAGAVHSYTHEVVDIIGFEKRQNLGQVTIGLGSESGPILSNFDLLTMIATPGKIPDAISQKLLPDLIATQQKTADLQKQLDGQNLASAQKQTLERDLNNALATALTNSHQASILAFYTTSDKVIKKLEQQNSVLSYPDYSRVLLMSTRFDNMDSSDQQIKFDFDLMKDNIRVIAYPGQNNKINYVFNVLYGFIGGFFESKILQGLIKQDTISVYSIMEYAQKNDIPLKTSI